MKTLSIRDAHVAAGATFVTVDDWELPAHYSDMRAEYHAVRHAVGIVDRSARGKICVTGNDRLRFLHGMVTNTVSGLAVGAGNHAALVTAQGHTLLDLWVHHLDDMLWLETEPGLAPTLIETLDKYLIADDVTLVDETDLWGLIGVHGPRSHALLASLLGDVPGDLAEHQTVEMTFGDAPVWVTARSYAGEMGYDVRVVSDLIDALWDALVTGGGQPVGFEALETRRVELGQPRCGAEIDASVTPLEVGLLDVVDFDKGCYIGQEVIAKMHFRGKPRRYLVGLCFDGAAIPTPGQDVVADGKAVGRVTSCTLSPALEQPVGLAVVRRGFHEPGQVATLSDGTTAQVTALPFVRH